MQYFLYRIMMFSVITLRNCTTILHYICHYYHITFHIQMLYIFCVLFLYPFFNRKIFEFEIEQKEFSLENKEEKCHKEAFIQKT